MFNGFANVWTPVVPAEALGKKPLPVKLAGEPLVVFRDGRGGVGALIDRCPHRGVALSLGEVGADGCLTCPFHGWAFRTDGACAHVPLNDVPDGKRARLGATSVPVREAGGLIWVFTGLDAASTEPELPPALTDPAWSTLFYAEEWSTHWTRAMENMLDWPHVPFVHRRTIGRDMRAKMRRNTVMRTFVEPTPWGAVFPSEFNGERSGMLMWRRPNGMELHILEPEKGGRGMRGHVYCVPVDEKRTRMVLAMSRTFLRAAPLLWLARLLNRLNTKILLEDRGVVESSFPVEVPEPGQEVSVATDGPTLHFRRYYLRELRNSSASLVRLGKRPVEAVPAEVETLPLAAGAEGR
jgi:phenylpropionate dioxygenase-like ring-hydroxylating dioxygenase large terminal subunit